MMYRIFSQSVKFHHLKNVPRSAIYQQFIITPRTSWKSPNFHLKSRTICTKSSLLYDKERSKVEQTVDVLKQEKKVAQVVPKRTLLKRVTDEIVHYYHGFRLLFIDIRVASRLIRGLLNGQELTRRERKQLVRTSSDVFRLLPFSVFIIVPFMELLLPVALKLFPGMLPSTFQTKSEAEEKFSKQFKMRLEVAKFLQESLDEMALKASGDQHSHTAKDFAQFFERIRSSRELVTNDEIMQYSKLFEDNITLENLTKPQLKALCQLLELSPIGTNTFLRFQLRLKLRNLLADDKIINKEGLDELTVAELQSACRSRGMRAYGLSEERLRSQLNQWLELSLFAKIPPSLLILSRALYLSDELDAPQQLKATLSTLAETAGTEAKYKIGEQEGKVDNKTKIELIKKEDEEIKKEKEEAKILEAADTKLEEIVEMSGKDSIQNDIAEPIVHKKTTDGISKEDLESLETAMASISFEKKKLILEKEELEDLKEDMAEYKEDIEEFKELAMEKGTKNIKESRGAKRLSQHVDKMIMGMNTLVDNLGKNKESLLEAIDSKDKQGESSEQEKVDVISINELMLAIQNIQKVSDKARLQKIADVLDIMDVDNDGAVKVDHVLKVIELIGQEDVEVSQAQMKDIIDLLQKEMSLEEDENKR